MTFDRLHLLLQWGGTLPGGEQWTNSIRLAGSDTGDNPTAVVTWQDLEDWLHGEIKTEVQVWHTSAGAAIHNVVKLTYCKLNYIKMDGHYLDPRTHEHVYAPTVAGNGSASQYPNQVALVVSLTTGLDRGYAHRGRFYMPIPTWAVQADGMIAAAQALLTANAAKTFIESVSDMPGLDLPNGPNAVVMSAHGTGATHPVTGIEVGRVLDTQRRRRAQLAEAYSAVAVDLGAA